MAVKIGSARLDERGKISGGSAGDQKQSKTPDYSGEVSMQDWYKHSKGWVLIRAKDATAREKIARNMEYACNNKNIGYDQSQNRTLYNIVKDLGFDCSKVTKKCETDCAQLVRVCVRYAGINCEDFYTANEKDKLKATGKFDIYTDSKYTTSSDYLLRGDILVTKTMGHTVVVLSNGSKATPSPTPAPSQTSADIVKKFQKFINLNYATLVQAATGKAKLSENGKSDADTRKAAVAVFKHMANKYYDATLTIGNENFLSACKLAAEKMTDKEVEKHPTLGYLIQGMLAYKGLYSANIDGAVGTKTKAAIKVLQKAKKLTQSGSMNGDTWYALFN